MNINQYDIVFSILAAISLFLLLAGFLVAFALRFQKRRHQHLIEMSSLKYNYEQQLLQSQIEVQEATYSALGKELHDNIGQLLISTKMLLGMTQRSLIDAPDTLMTAEQTLGKAINELRLLSKSLTKEWLEQFNLIENLQNEVTRINSADELHVYLSSPQTLSLTVDKQIILFRIIQEAIQNTLKHAHSKNLVISISEDNVRITVNIKDDGVGLIEDKTKEGLGMLNMKQRTQLLCGSIQWLTNLDKGSVINILIPLN